MNKYNNPRLLNTVVSGTGMKHPIQPHVVVGDESNGFIRGDLMDANAIVDLVNSILHPDEGGSTTPDPYNGHEYIDLGLPSGTKWAKMNVGATSETDTGLYFAWGETQGYTAAQCAEVDEDSVPINYRFYSQDGMTKYNTTDNLTHLELTDDAAAVNMGGEWHMPNGAQCLELLKETTIGYITDEGAYTQCVWDDLNFRVKSTLTIATVNGWNTAGFLFFKNGVTDINTAVSSGEYVFIPAAGYEGYEESGNSGCIWTSFRNLDNINMALVFTFFAGDSGIDGFPPFHQDERFIHQSIRGVVGQMDEIEEEPIVAPVTHPNI